MTKKNHRTVLAFLLLLAGSLWLVPCPLWAQNKRLVIQTRHIGSINALAYSPDGTRMLSGSGDQTAKLWNIHKGTIVANLTAHSGEITAVTFSPDGTQFATTANDSLVILWDARNGQELHRLKKHTGNINALAYSPDGKILLTGSMDNTARLWNTKKGRLRRKIQTKDPIGAVAFAPDGNSFLLGLVGFANSQVQQWGASGKKLLKTFKTKGRAMYLAFSPDSKRFLVAGRSRGDYDYISLWNMETNKEVRSYGEKIFIGERVSYYLFAIAFSPDGSKIAASCLDRKGHANNSFILWDANTGKKLMRFQRKKKATVIMSLAFSSDSDIILSGASDGMIHVILATNGALLKTHKGHCTKRWFDKTLAPAGVSATDLSPDGSKLLVANEDNSVRCWEFDAGGSTTLKILRGHQSDASEARFSPDGSHILLGTSDGNYSNNDQAMLWQVANQQRLKTGLESEYPVNAVAFSPDGSKKLLGTWYGVYLWQANGTNSDTLAYSGSPANGRVVWVEFSPDGKHFLSGWGGGKITIHNLHNGKVEQTLKFAPFGFDLSLLCAAYSSDGKKIAGGGAHKIKIWEAASGKLLQEIAIDEVVSNMKFSKDGQKLTAAINQDKIGVWELRKGKYVLKHDLQLTHPAKTQVTHFAISPNDSRVLMSCEDNLVRIWETTTGQLVGILYTRFIDENAWAVITPKGTYDGNAAGIKYLMYTTEDGKVLPVPPDDPQRVKGLLKKLVSGE